MFGHWTQNDMKKIIATLHCYTTLLIQKSMSFFSWSFVQRPLTFLGLLTFACFANANTLYQIDIILFTHQSSHSENNIETTQPVISSAGSRAILLQSAEKDTIEPFRLLPVSSSHLRNEYGALSHQSSYQILARYSWLQPSQNQFSVVLPQIHAKGWDIEGTLRIRQSNYYLLDTDLKFSSTDIQHFAFKFAQKQRLKPGAVYYLDHPQVGMLIKVQQIA